MELYPSGKFIIGLNLFLTKGDLKWKTVILTKIDKINLN